MKIHSINRPKFWGHYSYRVNVLSYKVLAPVTCCPHHTTVNNRPSLNYDRHEIAGYDVKLRHNNNHYRDTSVFFNDPIVLDNLVDAQDLLVYNFVQCNKEL